MTSIRRRTAALVALSMAGLLLVGGTVLFLVLRRAMTVQFDEALDARAGAMRSLIRFDGSKIEVDFAGEAMPRFARSTSRSGAGAEYFIVWVREGSGWRVLERSESLRTDQWPAAALSEGGDGVRDVALPDGSSGRAVMIEFVVARESDEEGEHRGEGQGAAARLDGAAGAMPPPEVRLMVALPRAALDRTLVLIGWCIGGVGVALGLVSIGASRWAVSRGMNPLRDLSQRVSALGPDTLGTRFDSAELPGELHPIAVQLSALLARLEEAFEREKRFSVAASHELRTPIAELRMLLEVASSQSRSSEEWRHIAGKALGVLGRAQALCEALLLLSRSGAGRQLPLSDARSEVGAILIEQVNRVLAIQGCDARLVQVESGPGLVARMDAATLGSIVGNLLDNAFRHGVVTPEAPVRVGAMTEGGRVVISIANLAPALMQEDVVHLFEPFWRKDDMRTDREGFGLGLSIARELARSQSGDLRADLSESRTLTMQLDLPSGG